MAVAAPVRDASGAVVAALSVGGPKARLTAAAPARLHAPGDGGGAEVSAQSGRRGFAAGASGRLRKEVTMKTHDVLVLGGGMIGSAVAFDLARYGAGAVTVADLREPALPRVRGRSDVRRRRADLSDPATRCATLAAGFDLVVGALPSVLGYADAARGDRGRHGRTSTSASWPRTRSTLDGLARERGVTAVVDCGVAPGVSNLMVGHAAAQLATGGRASRSTWAACRASAAGRSTTRRASRPPT